MLNKSKKWKFETPDWLDDPIYTNLEQLTKKQIAWEFLRRNLKYQKTYARYLAEAEKNKRASIAREAKGSFCIKGLYDPNFSPFSKKNLKELFVPPVSKLIAGNDLIADEIGGMGPTQVALLINIRVQPKSLLKRIQKIIVRSQKKLTDENDEQTPKNRIQYNLCARYIRLLDALTVSADRKSIATKLDKNKSNKKIKYSSDNLGKDIKKAEAYRDKNYYVVAFWAQARSKNKKPKDNISQLSAN